MLPFRQRCINVLQGQTYTVIDSLLCVRMQLVQITSGFTKDQIGMNFFLFVPVPTVRYRYLSLSKIILSQALQKV